MFLHLGAGYSVRTKEIIAIIDHGLFEEQAGKRKVVSCLEAGEEGVKSVVLTDREVYLSPISSLTLKKRACMNQNFYID